MLTARHQFIEGVTHTRVSPWNRRVAYSTGKQRASSVIGIKRLYTVPFYQCVSARGEYGVFITAHVYQCVSARGEYGVFITAHAHELETILESFLSSKKTLYIINSCQIYIRSRYALHDLIKNSSSQSELFLAHQAPPQSGIFYNYAEDVGTFGFPTTESERELFMHREEGLIRAIRLAFEKVSAT
jgi:hypothetical protein